MSEKEVKRHRGPKYTISKEGISGKFATATQRRNRLDVLEDMVARNRGEIYHLEQKLRRHEEELGVVKGLVEEDVAEKRQQEKAKEKEKKKSKKKQ
jgi:hypothetical protein